MIPRVRGGAGDDDLGTLAQRDLAHLVEVDALVGLGDAVRDEVVQLAARVDRRAVREVTALVELHPEHRVARVEKRQVHGHVRVGACVRLDVGVIGAEQRLRSLTSEVFDFVDHLVTAVVALAG